MKSKGSDVITEVNIGNHLGKSYVIETYSSPDDESWYRKWSDGWIEQGGFVTGKGSMGCTTVNLITKFTTTSYFLSVNASINISLSFYSNAGSDSIRAVLAKSGGGTNRALDSFIVASSNDAVWYASGY